MTRTIKTERKLNKLLSAAGIILAALSALLLWAVPASAAEEKGSLTLRCVYRDQDIEFALSNDEFSLVKIADAHILDGSISYTTLECFKEYDCQWQSLPASGINQKAAALTAYCTKNDMFTDSKTTDKNGELKFLDLDSGLYLAVRTKINDANSAYSISPMLIFIPETVNGKVEYNVVSTPKIGYININEPKKGSRDDTKKPNDPETPKTTKTPKTSWDDILPQTGQLLWPVVVLAVIGGFLILGGSAALPKEERNGKKTR